MADTEKYLRAALTPIVTDAFRQARVRAQALTKPDLPDVGPFVDAIVRLFEQTPPAPTQPSSPVVAAFFGPPSSSFRGCPVNVCRDGSWWVCDYEGNWSEIYKPLIATRASEQRGRA